VTTKQKQRLDEAQKLAEQAIDTRRVDREKLKRICADEARKVRK
jgi:hypothetical protein